MSTNRRLIDGGKDILLAKMKVKCYKNVKKMLIMENPIDFKAARDYNKNHGLAFNESEC